MFSRFDGMPECRGRTERHRQTEFCISIFISALMNAEVQTQFKRMKLGAQELRKSADWA